jgi:ribosomal protein S18 acetylase RimI-like enzyme
VDGDNEEALALYERAGMTTERSFVWYQRVV